MKVIVHPNYKYLEDFIVKIPEMFDKEGDEVYSGRNIVKKFNQNGTNFYVKRYKKPLLIQRIIYTFFRPTKTSRAYDFAAEFRKRGIDTPHEVAYIEIFKNKLFNIGYFISLECTYHSMKEEISNNSEFNKALIDSMVDFLIDVHNKGIFHGDTNLSNIYFNKENGKYKFAFIDINRSKFYDMNKKLRIENLTRLTHNLTLYTYIVRRYAQRMAWDETKTLMKAYENLYKLEQKTYLKKKLKEKKKASN